MPTIGLFGTCGKSRWRDPFIAAYDARGIRYFNPQVENWNREFAREEARHLANDEIILYPITRETYASGSLSEIGFSILNAIKLNNRRDFVVLVERELNPELDDPVAREESHTTRALVLEHLKKLDLSNVYLVSTLDEMLSVSLELHAAALIRDRVKGFTLTG